LQGSARAFTGFLLAMFRRCEFFCEFFYSRIDNNRLNSTLGIPEALQVAKF